MKERQIVETRAGERLDGMAVSYQRELVQCGKPRCRKWHGPYWYAYTRKDGRARSFYIGKQFRTLTELRAEAKGPAKGPKPSRKHTSGTRGGSRR